MTDASRVVLEKPIGHDLASAQAINDAVGAVFDERQIFRIDHYLGKESVQNLLVTRFANTLLEPLWNSSRIDHVQITAAESLGVGTRGDYYDKSGALRDMLQNHLLQVLCLVAMEPPTHIDRESVRDEKLKVLQALKPLSVDEIKRHTVTGQYGPGLVDGAVVAGYRDDAENADSSTETFVAVKAEINNWRWAGVPFYLRTGKRMSRRYSEIVVQFKPVPLPMFPGNDGVRAEPAGHLAAAGRGDAPGAHGQGAWAGRDPDAAGVVGAQLHRGVPAPLTRRLRAAADGRRPRRSNAVHAPRRGRSGLGVGRTDPAGMAGLRSYAPAVPGRHRRSVDAATLLERDGRRWREESA